jgi:DNA adenine methylase
VLDRYDNPDTLFYLDPPYYETSADRDHYRVGGDFDHERFVDELRDRDGDWIVSYQTLPPGLADVAETVETYTAMYSMSYDDERAETTERLAMNFLPSERSTFSASRQTTLDAVADGGNRSLNPETDREGDDAE